MLSLGKGKNNTNHINHTAEQVENVLSKSILKFYLTSYGDFLFQVEHSFRLLDQSGTFHMLEPRCHLRESQDLWVYEWEEIVEEFTQHASYSIITHLLCFWVKYHRLFSRHGFDLIPRFETACLKSILWKVFRSLSLSPTTPPPPQ